MGLVELFKLPLFWVAIILMICAGASELSMNRYTTDFEAATANTWMEMEHNFWRRFWTGF